MNQETYEKAQIIKIRIQSLKLVREKINGLLRNNNLSFTMAVNYGEAGMIMPIYPEVSNLADPGDLDYQKILAFIDNLIHDAENEFTKL